MKICSPFLDKQTVRVHNGQDYLILDDFDSRGLQVLADWAMDNERPTFIALNEVPGDILDDVLECFVTASKLRATLLCDLILFEACEVGKQNELVVTQDHIATAYSETKVRQALRSFLTALVAYQKQNGIPSPFSGKQAKEIYDRAPAEFKFDLMTQLSKPFAKLNPCNDPKRFLRVVDNYQQMKESARQLREEERKYALIEAQREREGTRETPLFVPE